LTRRPALTLSSELASSIGFTSQLWHFRRTVLPHEPTKSRFRSTWRRSLSRPRHGGSGRGR
jgi:hypothetical protein